MLQTNDLRVREIVRLISPRALKAESPSSEVVNQTVAASRERITRILRQEDPRLLVVVGPCSIHEAKGALEYAGRLNAIRQQVADRMEIVMRVYFEKPRTTTGWKGLINDPHLDNTRDVEAGLRLARKLLLEITGMGLPAATEFLDPIVPQYIADLISWAAIGARTTESQTHREMASGLSMPVGFKNTTSGAVVPAINAIKAAMQPQTFLGIDEQGRASVVATEGNPDCHVILRGGDDGANHDAESVAKSLAALGKYGLPQKIMIDASHANCGKDCRKMPATFREIVAQRATGTRGIIGAMLESNLVAGAQSLGESLDALVYGQSITDQCIDWATTEELVRELAAK